jgi:hypothetical protein
LASGIPWNADAVCFVHGAAGGEQGDGGGGFVAVPDDPDLLVSAGQGADASRGNYDPGMPPGWRCDSAVGTDHSNFDTQGYDGEGQAYNGAGLGPFGLNRTGGGGGGGPRWYRLPTGKGLPIAPPAPGDPSAHPPGGGGPHCGTDRSGWLSGWPAGALEQPDQFYATPADGSLPPPVGRPPAAGTICFAGCVAGVCTCWLHTPVRAVSCGAFALWELLPAPSGLGRSCYGYCLAPHHCAGCAAAGRCAAESWGGPALGTTCANDDSTEASTYPDGSGHLTCTSHYDGHPDRCGQSDDDDFTAATQCCACGGGFHDAEHLGHCACAAGWAGALCADALPLPVAGLPPSVSREQHDRAVAAGVDPGSDAVCFTAEFVTVPDDPNLLVSVGQGGLSSWRNYNPGMPPTWRCDAVEGTTGLFTGSAFNGEGHGPFGLRQGGVDGSGNSTRWYRLPVGKGLPTSPPGGTHCGTGFAGWLSGWPAAAEGQPGIHYSTPADGSLPPLVGSPPAAGIVCFSYGPVGTDDEACEFPTPVRAVNCGAFTLWELPPARTISDGDRCSGYCLAPDPCAGCAAAGRCAAESWGGPALGTTCANDDSTEDSRCCRGICSHHYDGHPERCGQSDDDDFTAATQCCACGGGFHDAEHLGHCACAAGWAGALCDQRTSG